MARIVGEGERPQFTVVWGSDGDKRRTALTLEARQSSQLQGLLRSQYLRAVEVPSGQEIRLETDLLDAFNRIVDGQYEGEVSVILHDPGNPAGLRWTFSLTIVMALAALFGWALLVSDQGQDLIRSTRASFWPTIRLGIALCLMVSTVSAVARRAMHGFDDARQGPPRSARSDADDGVNFVVAWFFGLLIGFLLNFLSENPFGALFLLLLFGSMAVIWTLLILLAQLLRVRWFAGIIGGIIIIIIAAVPALVGDRLGSPLVAALALSAWVLVVAEVARLRRAEEFGWITMLVGFVAFCQLLELMAWLLPNGDSRDLIRGEPKVVELPDLAARYHAQLSQQPTGRPVVVLVAAAGGGIRASYWTSAVLAHADRKAALRDKFLLASGVSGGSLGLALYRALVAVPDLRCRSEIGEPSLEACVTEFHSQDMLAGILGARLTGQMLNMLVPAYARSSVVLERSWEEGWERTFATTTSGDKAGAHLFAMSFHDLSRYPGPALVLNTTSVSSGDRAVVSNVRTPWLSTRSCFRNVAELMDLPLSSAANASARFPYLEDWGWIAIRDRKTACAEFEAVADGGFFDNYGAATTLDAYRHLKSLPVESGRPKPQFIVIQISSDPDCRTMRHLEDDGAKVAECESKVARRKKELEPRKVLNPWQSGWAAFGEENTEAMNFNANAWLWNFFYGVPGESRPPGPLGLAMQSRSMTGLDVALRLRDEVRREGDSYYHFSLAGALDVPLGWSLSRHAREQIDALLRDEGANRREMRRLDRELSAAAAPR